MRRPRAIYIGGVGSDQGFQKLRWTRWGASSASAKGRYLVRAKPGSPYSNSRLSWAVKLKLKRVRVCGGERFFTRAYGTFTHGTPRGYSKRLTIKIACS